MLFSALPEPQGLYDPTNEADSCGVAMVTDIQGRRSHSIVSDGLIALEHLEHRGAAGAEPNSGDGAGILIQLPVDLLRDVVDFELPAPAADGTNTFAAGICYLPQDPVARAAARETVEAIAEEEGLEVLGWRTVPVDPLGAEVGVTALGCMPYMSQLFVAAPEHTVAGIDLDRRVYPMRKRAERNGVYFPSLSSRTMVYKGMLTTMQLPQYFPDLRDERCISAIAIVHSRFSTNTFPSWPLAHPFRFVAHNGEINTVRGNRNRMHAREAMLGSARIPGDLSRLSPDLHARGLGFGVVRRGSRAAAPRWPQPAACRADDDPRGVGEQHHHGPRRAGVLAVPRLADGAVGRARLRDLHRRHIGRSGAGPQRVTARTLVAHHRRPHHPRQRERRAGRAVRPDRRQGSTAAGQDVPDRHRGGPHRLRRRDQRASSPRPSLTASGCTPDCSTSRRCPTGLVCSPTTSRWCAARSPSATPRRICASCSPRWPPRVPSRWDPWAPTPLPPCCRSGRGCCTTTSSNSSPR